MEQNKSVYFPSENKLVSTLPNASKYLHFEGCLFEVLSRHHILLVEMPYLLFYKKKTTKKQKLKLGSKYPVHIMGAFKSHYFVQCIYFLKIYG